MNENPEQQKEQIDMYWVVANIFALIYIVEEKFGPQAVEQLVLVASEIEKSMKEENNEQ
jgi:hypothetical protein